MRGTIKKDLYNLPLYYDIAFSWDIAVEIEPFQKYFKRYVPFEVKNILEPACGSGRFLVGLPKYGYRVTGYDKSPAMVAYSQKRIKEAGVQNMAAAIPGDMSTIKFSENFDAAITPINSLGYILSDEDIVSHFRNTGDALKTSGIYIIQLNCASDEFEPLEDEEVGDDWVYERDGVKVKTRWMIEKEDRQNKLSHQICKMEIDDHGEKIVLEDRHIERLWLYEDLVGLIKRSGRFKLEAIYDSSHKPVPDGTHISGELGNLYYILKAN
jgi:SAM-dependent methyltransferase